MTSPVAQALRKRIHLLIVVPLVVIATTWPTFPRIFDADEFWLHSAFQDSWLRLWDVWHFEQALAGQTPLYFTDSIFYPQGTSLAFYSLVFPHALLMIALKAVIPADDAYNLLFLLILCFNAFCGYALIRHLMKDKWIGLFGAVVIAVATPYPYGQTVPDLIMIGTLPLTIYFVIRSVTECNWRFAALAGLCAGVTAFIGVYIWAFTLLSVAILALFLSLSFWRRKAFWGGLLIVIVVCGMTSIFRFYPMLMNRADLKQATEIYRNRSRSNDVLENFVLPNNPITGQLFGAPPDPHDDYKHSIMRNEYKEAYLGYGNLILIACAFLFLRRKRRLLPWIVILLFFATMRLGSYLTFNGIEYPDILLPEGFLQAWIPAIFGNIGQLPYYQIGVVTPLAVIASYGLDALLRTKPAAFRRFIALLCILVISIEFYIPRHGQTVERQATAFVAWLHSQAEDQVKLVHLPLVDAPVSYYSFIQSLTGYPHANGHAARLKQSARRYLNSNLLLKTWRSRRSIHCLKPNEEAFRAALSQLQTDGFTHFVVHKWLYGDQFIIQSFKNIPPVYDDGYVSIYRVSDLRLSCQNQAAELPRFIQLARSASAAPGAQSAILSVHADLPINRELFDYLDALFSDWRSLVHIYQDEGELAMQNAGARYTDIGAFTKDNQVIHLLYNTRDEDADRLNILENFDDFNLCQREANDEGAVIDHYVSREFSCALVISGNAFEVQYDNGAKLENLMAEQMHKNLDLQLMWSNLPDDAYSVSVQIFDAAGEKALGQDSVIDHVTLDRHQIDVSSLPPGDYTVKLIMYNFATGAIVSGTVSKDGARFDRALDVAAIHRA